MAKRISWSRARQILIDKVESEPIDDYVRGAAQNFLSHCMLSVLAEGVPSKIGGRQFYDDIVEECVDIAYDKIREYLERAN